MNVEMAYLLGMVLGNGTIQRGDNRSRITIDIPHKNIWTDDGLEAKIYVQASLHDIRDIIGPLIGAELDSYREEHSTKISFEKNNNDYLMREIFRMLGWGVRHQTMEFSDELFTMTRDEIKSFVRGFADVTGYIRKSNIAFGKKGAHRVYIEIPTNWDMVIGLANLIKSIDVPVQTIDFGHPNFRDSKLKKYNEGKRNYWKKEHQLKIWANEFMPIGFNIRHKQEALERLSGELLEVMDPEKTHKFYWQRQTGGKKEKPIHPVENDESLPLCIRGKHFNKWQELADTLGYHE